MNEKELFQKELEKNELKYVRHNKTDFQAFRKFQKDMDERYASVERNRALSDRKASLELWKDSLPKRWQKASFANMDEDTAHNVLKLIKDKGWGSFFITGAPNSGKTFIGYAIIRKMIGAGKITPGQVRIISEETLLSYAYMGYEGGNKFNDLLNNKGKLFLLDNVGNRDSYDVKKEVPLLERFVDHIYSNSLMAIFTSNGDPKEFSRALGDSSKSKFSQLISDHTILTKSEKSTENSVIEVEEENNEELFASFGN